MGVRRSQASSEGRRTLTLLGCRASSEAAARREGRDSSPRASRRACPTSAGTRCDGRRRLPLQPLLQRPSLPGAWARSDSAACRPQRRCCAGGGRGHAGLDQRLPLSCSESTDLAVLGFNFKALIWPFLASILRMSWHQLKACPRPRPTSSDLRTVFGFCYLLVWGYIADCRFVNGTASATRAPCGQSP